MQRYSTNLKREAKDGKTSIIEVLKDSSVGQQQYEIQDPSERLMSIVGSSLFNEPKYYPTTNGNNIGGGTKQYLYNDTSLDENAKLIIKTALEIADSNSPRDLLAIASWARTELRIRTTPQILLAVAANHPKTKQFVRDYCTKIIQRPDEIKQVFAAYRHLFGTKHALPACLKKGLAVSFHKNASEFSLLKWDSKERPRFSDVLRMVDRRTDYPISKNLSHYLNTGEVLNPEATPLAAARAKLAKYTEFNREAKNLAKAGRCGWENILSQFGNTKETWEFLVNENLLGYMALLRNLRNICNAEVHERVALKVQERLANEAVDSKQLPFRFLAAIKALNESSGPSVTKEFLHKGLADALENIVNSLPEVPGSTLVAVDISGSMQSQLSDKSHMTISDAACVLGSVFFKRSNRGHLVVFADSTLQVNCPITTRKLASPNDRTLSLIEAIQATYNGGGTNAESVLRFILDNKIKVDRIILLSDMQTYGAKYSYHSNKSKDLAALLDDYRRKINSNAYFHSIDLAGYGKSITQQGDTKTNLVSGFSEKLLDTILSFEGIGNKDNEQKFSLEHIREKF